MLPRDHKASRTLRVKTSPAEVWPVLMQATQSSDVPSTCSRASRPIVLSSGTGKNFGGTWAKGLNEEPARSGE